MGTLLYILAQYNLLNIAHRVVSIGNTIIFYICTQVQSLSSGTFHTAYRLSLSLVSCLLAHDLIASNTNPNLNIFLFTKVLAPVWVLKYPWDHAKSI